MVHEDECTANDKVFESLLFLKTEADELYLPTEVAVIQHVPKPIDFFRDWVAPNLPVLIKGGARHWPAISKWTPEYLTTVTQDKEIAVAVTPNGYADAISSTQHNGLTVECFVLPEERKMRLSELFTCLNETKHPQDEGIFYLQRQNSNLTEDFAVLLADIDKDLSWATEAFGKEATATNLWIGDQRAVTSLHKDPFENIYCVISGCKEFILLPPTDRPWLPYKTYPIGKYKKNGQHFEIEMSDDVVPWVDFDPCCPDLQKYPNLINTHPLKVRVEEGDMLYLPSLWFHHVRQSHQCIALNFWYDMNFDIKFAYYQMVDRLASQFNL